MREYGSPYGIVLFYREALMRSGLDGRVIVGLLTLERVNMLPDTATGVLKRVGSFILTVQKLAQKPGITYPHLLQTLLFAYL
jgi:hypothetical protein